MAATAAASGSVRDALRAAAARLRAAGAESPRLDAELLLAEAAGAGRAWLHAHPEAAVAPGAARRFAAMIERRARREPIAYILGRKAFRRIELAVDRRVLIPRPETELLVEAALELRPLSVLDVGTGSGAIALAIADELPEARVLGLDSSAGAIEVARANARRLGLADRAEFRVVPADGLGLLSAVAPPAAGGYDLVVANLPYVAGAEWAGLPPEIRDWEPREAVVAGPDGLGAIRALLAAPPPCRAIALEVGISQAEAVAELVRGAGFPLAERRRDLAGIERAVVGYRERRTRRVSPREPALASGADG